MKNERIQRDLERMAAIREAQLRGEYSFPHIIDSTMRSTLVECEEKFHYQHIQHLRPDIQSIHLHAGQVFAKGLETVRFRIWRDGYGLEEALIDGFAEMLVAWGDYEIVWSWDHPEEYKTLDQMILALDYYFYVWPPHTDFLQPLMEDGEPALEFTFALPIPETAHPETGDPIIYCGRTDMLALREESLFVEDDKTTKQLGAQWSQQWDLRSQFTGYCWAAQEYGYPVAGVIVRGVAVQKIQNKHGSAITYRPQWVIDRWLRQLIRNVNDGIEAWKTGDYRMALDSACEQYGGCPFKLLCKSPNPSRWIESEYIRQVWDPLADT